ncbi:transglutaminase family protein [Nocardioides abyssi]|uniref:DUF3488 and transglutaminase-like domain-containing protein n=1 Tax=Nocardioides abyssi TaxID=3058370 RepID=A0ABT8EYD5_9ACTN|nr:DUF3488 and transglutaminase-like domain-containing protein [Nocardioides abyssi]MDN4163195.1 DUF3488 and transglutaminase-like domain-containing protein [Nocardioides abyssi]
MTPRRASRTTTLAVSATAAATTWVAMMAWRPFTAEPERYLVPLAVVGAVVVGCGALARWARVPAAVVVLAQVLAGTVAASLLLTGYPLPLGPGLVEMEAVVRAAVDSANQYAPPVPASAPGVHPLLVLGGLGCFVLVDALVATLRRVSWAGVPLLSIYSVPVGVLGGGLSWWVFLFTAAGFLLVLYLHEGDRVTRWGRSVEQSPSGGFGVRTGRLRTTAAGIGGVALALAVAVPLAIPTFDVRLVDLGRGPGGGDDIELTNPLADLKRDLVRGDDDPVLRFTTDDPDPSYLRTTALTWFNGQTWSAGDREVPTTNLPTGGLPPFLGVDPGLRGRTYDYRVNVYESFRSSWLPAWATSTAVRAEGDWRYDLQTRDFLAADKELDTAGLDYELTGIQLDYDAAAMAQARSSAGVVPTTFTELPDIPDEVRDLAIQVTREAPTRYEKAVALQRWFRETGGFEYSTDVAEGNATDDLVSFLRPEGRRGYCEQYAASMAVMARMLGIPARVAVGFLRPERIGQDTWEYSAHDLHAWPELFFAGSGWVRFEPTPAARAATAPPWTRQDVAAPDPETPDRTDAAAPQRPDRPDLPAAPVEEEPAAADDGDSDALAWLLPTVGGLLLAGLLVGLAVLPRTIRTRRRGRRLSAGPEPAWAELRDTALDLRLSWPPSRSPRQTADWLAEQFGAPTDDRARVPRRGAHLDPDAGHALGRVVAALEVLRYSPRAEEATATLRAEVETVTDALYAGAPPRARRLAAWWPRSVLLRAPRPADSPTEPGQTRYGGVVDHVRG